MCKCLKHRLLVHYINFTYIFAQYPSLKHLNLIKNPVNPMFSGQASKYELFRAKFKIWMPTLVTLDGTDFNKDNIEQHR